MICIEPDNILPFMKVFLMGDTFDEWDFIEGSIQTHSTIHLDGNFQSQFYGEELDDTIPQDRAFSPWKLLKNVCKEFIKGKHTPLAFKFVLRLNDEETLLFLSKHQWDIPTKLYLNIHFEKGKLFLTSGTALETFSLDKTLETAWDQYLEKFLYDLGIS